MLGQIDGVTVRESTPELDTLKENTAQQIKLSYDLNSIKDNQTFRAYREFFWKIKVDPTKTRPAAEALTRRIAGNKPFPRVNSLVDAYNLASVKTEIAIAAFDRDKLNGNLLMRFALKDEEFLGIGMNESMKLSGGEVIISDAEKLVAIYPYRDAETSKVTEGTKNVLILVCGVPGIRLDKMKTTMEVAFNLITRFCGGTAKGFMR